MSTTPVVVGLDHSEGARTALRWVTNRADRFGPIYAVLAWDYPMVAYAPAPFGWPVPPVDDMGDAAREGLNALLETARSEGIAIEGVVVQGSAAQVLIEAAQAHDAVLVVGSRGQGGFARTLLGSVSAACAAHSEGPLVVVPAEQDPTLDSSERIVVGHDGSTHADSAVRFALTYARPGDEVVAVRCWEAPIVTGYEAFVVDWADIEAATRKALDEDLDVVERDSGCPGRLLREVHRGDPRRVLRREQERSQLCVIGQRGHTGLAELFLGSTATGMVHKPAGPVVIVP